MRFAEPAYRTLTGRVCSALVEGKHMRQALLLAVLLGSASVAHAAVVVDADGRRMGNFLASDEVGGTAEISFVRDGVFFVIRVRGVGPVEGREPVLYHEFANCSGQGYLPLEPSRAPALSPATFVNAASGEVWVANTGSIPVVISANSMRFAETGACTNGTFEPEAVPASMLLDLSVYTKPYRLR